jgi:cytochrome c biogenesis protein CcmG/thiol:disulfide interchange protein DsbE
MKRLALPLALLALVLASIGALQRWQERRAAGYMAADFTLTDLNGQVHRLADLRGKVVFLNLWTTWCPPCRTEMPAMEALYQRLKDRDFVMLAVSEDERGAEVVAPFVAELDLSFPVLLDPEARLSPRYGVTGYPETFVIDREGRVVNHIIGPAHWHSEEYVRYFEALLDQPHGAVENASTNPG